MAWCLRRAKLPPPSPLPFGNNASSSLLQLWLYCFTTMILLSVVTLVRTREKRTLPTSMGPGCRGGVDAICPGSFLDLGPQESTLISSQPRGLLFARKGSDAPQHLGISADSLGKCLVPACAQQIHTPGRMVFIVLPPGEHLKAQIVNYVSSVTCLPRTYCCSLSTFLVQRLHVRVRGEIEGDPRAALDGYSHAC